MSHSPVTRRRPPHWRALAPARCRSGILAVGAMALIVSLHPIAALAKEPPPARVTVPPPEQREKIANKAKKPAAQGAKVDYSGHRKQGKASYYGPGFQGKKMANGERMNPQANAAASKTLPIGSKVEVRNLENNRTAQVEITDRGPYVKDRIVDVTPKVADQLDLKKDGVAPVEVKPLVVPQPDGTLVHPAPTR